MRKKKILFLTDYAGAFTGFGKQCKLLLTYLFKTGKYEILNLAQGVKNVQNSPTKPLDKFPWKTVGTIPEDGGIEQRMGQDPGFARHVAYGALSINNVVKDFKPDVIFAINDTWGSQFITDQPFFDKIPSVCWNTFDSLPLLEDTIQKAPKISNYWTWSQFATDELHKHGFTHVKTQYPLVNTNNFYRLSDKKIQEIKARHSIPHDSFIIGFVFRNQLRKLINTQIEAYSIFKKNNPQIKNTFLYTHTHYSEGWDIPRLCKQYGVNQNEVLCTYICTETKTYFILPFSGQNIQNPITKNNTLITSNSEIGITDEQLNEIYNIFSIYSHPATSGACELPCVEAALTEKIILTCKYSFGEDIINNNKGSIEMPFAFYTEHGTHFLKSQPFPDKLAELFAYTYNLDKNKKNELELQSRKWAIENYSIEKNGKEIEQFIDNLALINFDTLDIEKVKTNANPNARIPETKNAVEWLKSLYDLILGRTVTDEDEGLKHWIQKLQQNINPKEIEAYFRKVASDEISKRNQIAFKDIFSKNDEGSRILVIIPEHRVDVFYSTSLIESIKSAYPEYNIYVATKLEYFDILAGNKNIYSVIQYIEQMEDISWLERKDQDQKSLFEIVFPLHHCYNKAKIHQHNFKDKITLSLK